MSFSKKAFEDFNENKTFSLDQTTPWNTHPEIQHLYLALLNSNN